MDEEKALEQLDTLLEEISKIDAPSTQAEQKPLLSNIDILEQSISQKSSNNESTDGSFNFDSFYLLKSKKPLNLFYIFDIKIIFLSFA
jgi:hypothetical protein